MNKKEGFSPFQMLQIPSQSDQRLLRYHVLNISGAGKAAVLF